MKNRGGYEESERKRFVGGKSREGEEGQFIRRGAWFEKNLKEDVGQWVWVKGGCGRLKWGSKKNERWKWKWIIEEGKKMREKWIRGGDLLEQTGGEGVDEQV